MNVIDPFNLKHLVSTAAISRKDTLWLLDEAIQMIPCIEERKDVPGVFRLKKGQHPPGAVSIMKQPSTGTEVSTTAAFRGLGFSAPIDAIRDMKATSGKKAERLRDFICRLYLQAGIRVFGIRGPFGGLTSALSFEFDSPHPPHTMIGGDTTFIDCGEGDRFHPTQILMEMTAMAVWDLFGKALQKDQGMRTKRPHFLAAVKKFCQLSETTRRQKIAAAIDGKCICFAGDMDSRILFDWLSVGRKDASGQKKFDVRFILVAPDFAQVPARYLQGVDYQISKEFHPDLPADIFYRLRWRLEDQAPQFREMIEALDKTFQVDKAFLDRLLTRDKPAIFFDALPVDKWHPSIDYAAMNHPASLCWLQAWCSQCLRRAAAKIGYWHWRTEAAAQQYWWRLPEPRPANLRVTEHDSFAEHQRRYLREKPDSVEDAVRLQLFGCNLDKIPCRMSTLYKRVLVASGLPEADIITREGVIARNGNGPPKDIMWFQRIRLDQWNPQILAVLTMLAGTQITYNVFDQSQDLFEKMVVEGGSRVVGILRCPSGVNKLRKDDPEKEYPECIDGHPEEVQTASIFDLYGEPGHQFARCFYCGGLHTAEEMSQRLQVTLPTT